MFFTILINQITQFKIFHLILSDLSHLISKNAVKSQREGITLEVSFKQTGASLFPASHLLKNVQNSSQRSCDLIGLKVSGSSPTELRSHPTDLIQTSDVSACFGWTDATAVCKQEVFLQLIAAGRAAEETLTWEPDSRWRWTSQTHSWCLMGNFPPWRRGYQWWFLER